MGTFNISTKEIFETIEEALDNLEGDFSDEQLKRALDLMKCYPYVTNTKSEAGWKRIKREEFK